VKHTSIFFVLCFLLSCSTYETSEGEQCLEWTTRDRIDEICTRQPYRLCFDYIVIETKCLRRGKLA
jgi:hypothetical protein